MKRMLAWLAACLVLASTGMAQDSGASQDKLRELEARLKKLEAQLQDSQAKLQRELEKREADFRNRAMEGQARAEEALKQTKRYLAERLKAKSVDPKKKESFVGLQTEVIPELLSAHLKGVKGLMVTHVIPDSPAQKAGIQNHDIIVSFNGQALSSPNQFKELVTKEKPGTKVKLALMRGGDSRVVEITLGERSVNELSELEHFFFDPTGTFKGHREAVGPHLFKPLFDGEKFRGAPFDWKIPESAKEHQVTVKMAIENGKVTITADATKDGKKESATISGTLDEVKKKIHELPEAVRDSVKQSLDNIKMDGGNQIRIEIKSDGAKKQTNAGKAQKFMMLASPDGKAWSADLAVPHLLEVTGQPLKLESMPAEIRLRVKAATDAIKKAEQDVKRDHIIIRRSLDSQ